MISPWYFCASLKLDAQQASTWLAVLDQLEVRDSNERVATACAQLDNADTWQQAYALPFVLRSVRDVDGTAASVVAARRFMKGLADLLPDDVAPPFQAFADALLDRRPLADVVKEALDALQKMEALPAREPSQRPYIDLHRFLPEAILLALLGELVARGARDLVAQGDNDPFAQLADRALQHAFGRLPFLLAIDLELERRRVTPEQLEQRIWTAPLCDPGVEPDLLDADARVMLAQCLREPGRTVDALVDESILLGRLRAHLAAQGRRKPPPAAQQPDLIPLAQTDLARFLLPVVFWQLALWERAVRLDPQTAMRRLSALWGWEPATMVNVVSIRGPLESYAGAWKRCAEALLALRGLKLEVRIEQQEQLDLPAVTSWLLFAPWVQLDPQRRPTWKDTSRYPRPLDVVEVIRLFGSAVLAVRLLRTLPSNSPDEDPRSATVPALLVHARDVLAMYGRWLRDRNEPEVTRRLGDAETILALFADRQCKHAGQGHYERIAPERFTRIFALADRQRPLAPDAYLFVDEILPRTLLSFIADGYNTALDDAGPGRWLTYLVPVYDRYRRPRLQQTFLDDKTRLQCELLVRFLAPRHAEGDIRAEPGWLRLGARDGGWAARSLQPRHLLLGPPLPAHWWQPSGWQEPEENEKGAGIRLARTIERFASLVDPGALPAQTQDQWRQEFADSLDSISRHEELDRFLRLRLLDLLGSPLLRDDAANQQRIALLLLEYGSPYDQLQMLQRMFPAEDSAWGEGASSASYSARVSLLRALLDALARPFERNASVRGERDPIDLENELRHIRLLREAVRRVALRVNPPRTSGDEEIIAVLRNQPAREATRHNEAARLVSARIEIHDGRERLVLDEKVDFPDWQVSFAARDPNLPGVALTVDRVEVSGCKNLFECAPDELAMLSPASVGELTVLGLVVGLRREEREYVLNCGLEEYIYAQVATGPRLPVGAAVSVRLRAMDTHRRVFRHDKNVPITPLRPRPVRGTLRRAKVWTDQGRRSVRVEIAGEPDRLIKDDRGDWDADHSRCFAPDGDPPTVGLARVDGAEWIPVDRSFDELLAAEWTQDEGRLLVLCYLGRGPGDEGYRFQRRPGENYILAKEHFTDAGGEQLEERVRYPRARGLLVTVSPLLDGDIVRLALANGTSGLTDEMALRRYPRLCLPFDERNLSWSALPALSGSEPAMAVLCGGRWVIKVDPPIAGYRDTIQVKWVRYSPDPRKEHAMARVHRWGAAEQAAAAVSADAVAVASVDYRREERSAFYARWLSLRVGDRIWLDKVDRLNHDGQFPGYTDQGLRVLVDGETVTMRFIGEDFRLSEKRECEVTSNRSWASIGDPIVVNERELPSAIVESGGGRGIFVQVPYRRSSRRLCKILWQAGGICFEAEIILTGLPDRLELGMVAHVSRGDEGSWRLQVEGRLVSVRALWKLVRSDHLPADVVYLGRARCEDDLFWLAEGRVGELIALPAAQSSWRHLAQSDGADCYGGLEPQSSSMVTSNIGTFHWGHERRFRRANLTFPHGALTGVCDADGPQQRVVPSRVFLTLRRAHNDGRGDELYCLQRRFELTEHRTARRPSDGSIASLSPLAEERYQRLLDEYFDVPTPQTLDGELKTATLVDGRSVVQVEISPQGGNRYFFPTRNGQWGPRLDLGPDEEPWFAGADYRPGNCRVILKRVETGYVASFRDVPAMGTQDFRMHVARSVPLGQTVKLPDRLYYIGREEVRDSNEGISGWWHRFEWGRGYTLFVPAHELQFNGEPFANAGLVLFHGDSISAVRFVPAASPIAPANSAGNEGDEEDGMRQTCCILSIEDANIELSQARTLYDQRTRHKIVHLLKMKRRATPHPAAEVDHVLGFDAAAAAGSERPFHLNWRVSVEGSGTLDDVKDGAYVLARLNEKAFEDSFGRTVSFRRVALSLEGAEAGALDAGELVFLRAGRTESKRNDIALHLRPVTDFAGPIGPDLRSVLVLRRRFSCRQDLLRRIHEARLTEQELTDKLLLVKLVRDSKQEVVADLVESMPPRRRSVLRQGAGRDHMLLCTVADFLPDASEPKHLRLELRPGVFVEIPLAETDLLDEVMTGDIVRVEVAEERYRVFRAASGDVSFVPAEGRPAVVLPKNRLISDHFLHTSYRSNGFWAGRRGDFSVGGLPNIEPIGGGFDPRERRWRPLFAADAIRLMETPHPRLGMLVRDRNEERRFWLWPCLEGVIGGRLVTDAARRLLRLLPIASPLDDDVPLPVEIPWTHASFADQSIAEIQASIEQHRWTYHDTTSGHWERSIEASAAGAASGAEHSVRRYDLGLHGGSTGPIFAEAIGRDSARLRYTPESFVRFAYPVAELQNAFAGSPSSLLLITVAGVSERGGLWLELAPGRIVELPAQLVVRHVLGEERSLAALHWQAFAPGDRVALRPASSEPLSIDRFALEDWQPGVRGAFGTSTALLPVAGHDADRGELALGAGAFVCCLPFAGARPPERVALRPDNSWSEVTRLPLPGETVILILGEGGRPAVAGYPELRPLADRKSQDGFAGDPLENLLCGSESVLARTIEAAGSAIPVTVGAVFSSQRVLYFHRQHQLPASRLPFGLLGRARVLGAVGRTLILRLGGGHFLAAIGDVVSGLPEQFYSAVADVLRDRQAVVWIRTFADGRTVYRADVGEPTQDIVAATECVVEMAHGGTVSCGLVCRDTASAALFWLPAIHAAWTELTRDELSFLFERRRSFLAQLVRDASGKGRPFLSVVQMQTVQREFRQLRLGAELGVRVELRRNTEPGQPVRYLVTTSSSRVALSYEGPADDSKIGKEIQVEVLRRVERPPHLEVAQPGYKTFRLDLPSIIVSEIARPDSAKDAFDAGGLAGDEEAVLRNFDPLAIPKAAPEELDRILAAIFQRARSLDTTVVDLLPLCSLVAKAWKEARLRDRELSLAHALMAVLLFDRVASGGVDRAEPEERSAEMSGYDAVTTLARAFHLPASQASALRQEHLRLAVELTVDVGRRALRSRHVELLSHAWLFYEEPGTKMRRRTRRDDLWGRLRQIAPLLGQSMKAEDLGRLRNMCLAIELRSTSMEGGEPVATKRQGPIWASGLPAVAAALWASLGEARSVDLLCDGAPMLSRLATMARTLPRRQGGPTSKLDRRHVRELRELVDAIRSRGWNLWLLEPLPSVEVGTRNVTVTPDQKHTG